MTIQTTLNSQGPGSSFAGPVIAGPRNGARSDGTQGANQGILVAEQVVSLTQNGTNAVSATMYIPKHSQIVDFYVDTSVIWNSATSAILSIGTTAADTVYVSGLHLETVTTANGRLKPTFTTTQLTNMSDTGSNEPVVVTVTPTGATSAGTVFVSMLYRQTQNYQNP